MNFLGNLNALMKNKGITKKELAQVLGVSPSTITMWFTRGYKNVNLSTVIKISNYFEVTIDELVNGIIEEETNISDIGFSVSEIKALKNFTYYLVENKKFIYDKYYDLELLDGSELDREIERLIKKRKEL